MKRIIILFLTIALTYTLSAQNNQMDSRSYWIDLQIVQHIGLTPWSNTEYVSAGLPSTTITEIRGAFNFSIFRNYIGGFADVGLGIMPAPKMQSLNLEQTPLPYSGTQYYLREMLSQSGNSNTSVNIKMTFGLFAKISVNENLNIMPYFGGGFLTMPQRKYEFILKEHGSNMQYQTTYCWNYDDREYGDFPLGYLTGRLNFNYRLSPKINLLLGLEYTWFLTTVDFYGSFTNTFNANVERDFIVKGNKTSMLGISAGISF